MLRNLICRIVLTFTFCCLPEFAEAQVDWSNTTNNNPFFHIGSNWVGGSPPGASDTARFNRFGTYEVWWDATTASSSPEVGELDVIFGDVTFSNQDNTTQHQISAGQLRLSGSITKLTNRGLGITSLELLVQSGATLVVDGAHAQGSVLNAYGTGMDVAGNLNIHSGGMVLGNRGYIAPAANTVGAVTVSGENSVWETYHMKVGAHGDATLLIQDGAKVMVDPASSTAWVSMFEGSTGTVTVTGAGSEWDNGSNNQISRGLYLGFRGDGTLNVEDGGKVTCSSLNASWRADAILNVTTGGQISSRTIELGGGQHVGTGSGGNLGTTTALFSGTGTQIDTVILFVSGDGGEGTGNPPAGGLTEGDATLTIEAGAIVNATAKTVISEDNGIGIASLSGSGTTLNTGELWVANKSNGMGTLSIESGAILNSNSASINRDNGGGSGIGVIEVSGTGTQWLNSTDLRIGQVQPFAGNGFLDINNGAVVSIGTDISMSQNGHLTISDASVIVFGACLMDGTFTVSNNAQSYGVTFQCSGVTTNSGGGIDVSNRFDIEPTGELRGFGLFDASAGWFNDGTMSFYGGNATVNGSVDNSGTSAMSFAADSEVTFSNVVINSPNTTTGFELGGTNIGEFGQMICADDFTIDGVLSVTLADGFDLDYEQTFLIVNNGGAASGIFDNLPEGAVVGNYNGIDLRITYVAGDGDDIALFTDPAPISPTLPMGRKFLDGFDVSGNLGSIHASNDQYWEIEPSPTTNPAKQKVDLMLLATSPTTTPTALSFRLESRMTGGDSGPVIQQVYFIRPSDNGKELVDSRPVTNTDESIIITPAKDISRFVNPLNGDIIAKVVYITDPSGPLFEWNVEIDEAVWLIE